MPATLIIRERMLFADGAIIEIKVWQVPSPVLPSPHDLKYSLFYGYPGRRILAYDNERGKGDHRHRGGLEETYAFVSIERLLADFRSEVETLRGGTI